MRERSSLAVGAVSHGRRGSAGGVPRHAARAARSARGVVVGQWWWWAAGGRGGGRHGTSAAPRLLNSLEVAGGRSLPQQRRPGGPLAAVSLGSHPRLTLGDNGGETGGNAATREGMQAGGAMGRHGVRWAPPRLVSPIARKKCANGAGVGVGGWYKLSGVPAHNSAAWRRYRGGPRPGQPQRCRRVPYTRVVPLQHNTQCQNARR